MLTRHILGVGGGRRLRWLALILLLTACDTITVPSLDFDLPLQATATPEMLAQWAGDATASSHFGVPDWSPRRATGVPDVPGCMDDARAWASARGAGVEWLQLSYNEPVDPVEVRVYQTYGRGAITRVTLIDTEGNNYVVWEGEDPTRPCPGILSVTVRSVDAQVSTVRIDLDESRTGYWNQIDAVELIGMR